MKPLAFIDVDGVLNIISSKPLKPGMTQQEMTVQGRKYPIRLKPEVHADLLRELEEAGFEMAWGTTWEDEANRLIAPELGLSRWPVAMVEGAWLELPTPELVRDLGGYNWKATGILALAGDRPFIWIDDDLWKPDHAWAIRRSATIPTKLIKTNPKEGLMPHHVRKAKQWLADNEL
jgi:hypothetical protein